MHNRKLSTHSLNEHGTQHWSLHSLPHKREDFATFSSNNISQHSSQHTIHAQHCSQFLHTRQTITQAASPVRLVLGQITFQQIVGLVPRLQRQSGDETIGPGIPRKLVFTLRVCVSRNCSCCVSPFMLCIIL